MKTYNPTVILEIKVLAARLTEVDKDIRTYHADNAATQQTYRDTLDLLIEKCVDAYATMDTDSTTSLDTASLGQ